MPPKLWMSLLLLAAAMASVSAQVDPKLMDRICQQFTIALCPNGFPMGRGSSCYSISVDFKSFDEAKVACANAGAKLAEIETAEENEYLKQYARLDGSVGYWIGGSDQAVEGSFKWVSNGRPLTFTDWYPGMPDDATNEDCVEIRVQFNAKWNDHLCSERKRYICETIRF